MLSLMGNSGQLLTIYSTSHKTVVKFQQLLYYFLILQISIFFIVLIRLSHQLPIHRLRVGDGGGGGGLGGGEGGGGEFKLPLDLMFTYICCYFVMFKIFDCIVNFLYCTSAIRSIIRLHNVDMSSSCEKST